MLAIYSKVQNTKYNFEKFYKIQNRENTKYKIQKEERILKRKKKEINTNNIF